MYTVDVKWLEYETGQEAKYSIPVGEDCLSGSSLPPLNAARWHGGAVRSYDVTTVNGSGSDAGNSFGEF